MRGATKRLFGDTFRKVANSAVYQKLSGVFALLSVSSHAAQQRREGRIWKHRHIGILDL